jgi:hypothetical protein
MNRIKNSFIAFLGLIVFLCLTVSLQAQIIYKGNSPNSPTDYPAATTGTGHLVAGDLWDSFMPANKGPFSSEATSWTQYGMRQFMRHGNFDRQWSTSNGHWPIAYPFTIWWAKYLHVAIYDSDPTFCPARINNVANPAYETNSKNDNGDFTNYVNVTFHPNLNGANDPNRNYSRIARFVDGTRRNHVVYESAWPTNVGLDVKVRCHQFAAPNWNHLNDFIIIEVSFKNVGYVDLNLDGTAEKTNHKIEGLTANFSGDSYMSTGSDIAGGRTQIHSVNVPARMGGYVGDDDPQGNPWNLTTMYTGTSADPATVMDMGLTVYQLRYYLDQYHGWTWISSKKGGLPADLAKGTANNEDKNNIWGVDAIGKGTQRGWFTSSGAWQGLSAWYNAAKGMFYTSAGAYYVDGGKNLNANTVDLKPNPKFFDIAQNNEPEAITKWVPKKTTGITEAERPNGDRKLLSLEGNAFTNVNDPDGAGYSAGWGKMSKGFSKSFNFDGELFQGIGPVSLEVGEEITLVYTIVSGYRLEGVQKALRAARYAYENDYVVPTPPPLPDMRVRNTLTKTVGVEWDNVAESDPNFAGYKIWKSSNHKRYNYLDDGMRIVDRYHEQMTPITGVDANSEQQRKTERAKYAKPVNPRFNATNVGQYAGYTWGTWDLMAVIPKSELENHKAGVMAPYTYMFDDEDVIVGFQYWYYVSAYSEGTFTGPGGETTNRIETHSTNRNGASGLWEGTWPFATGNAYFDLYSDTAAVFLKNVGAGHTVTSARSTPDLLNNGTVKVGVRPNPYKKAAMHDNYNNVHDHKIMFYNLPAKAKITITDVAGKVIQVANFISNDATKGSWFWDLFSKDGNEVASGLYLYYIEWDGGFDKGKFAILR